MDHPVRHCRPTHGLQAPGDIRSVVRRGVVDNENFPLYVFFDTLGQDTVDRFRKTPGTVECADSYRYAL
jgi:hypothetical protein